MLVSHCIRHTICSMAQPTLPANDCKLLSVAVFGSAGFLAVTFIGSEGLHACVQFVDNVADATPRQACMHHVACTGSLCVMLSAQ